MSNLEIFSAILTILITSIGVYYTYRSFKKKPELTTKTTQFTVGIGDNIGGDKIGGDKIGGDKIGGDKIVHKNKDN
jgi:hypothetical protein